MLEKLYIGHPFICEMAQRSGQHANNPASSYSCKFAFYAAQSPRLLGLHSWAASGKRRDPASVPRLARISARLVPVGLIDLEFAETPPCVVSSNTPPGAGTLPCRSRIFLLAVLLGKYLLRPVRKLG